MNLDRNQQLKDILAISNKMLARARASEWNSVAELERERKALVMDYFDQPMATEDVHQVAEAIKEILTVNQLVTELGEQCRDLLGAEIRTNKVGKAAAASYLDCTR